MQLFKRISSTVLASVDKVIIEIENHDAVIDSMLKELKVARAQCAVRLNRVAKDGITMQSEHDKLIEQEQQWTVRAAKLAEDDEQTSQTKAIACLERRRKVHEKISQLEHRLSEHQKLKQQLQDQLRTIDERFSEINNKKHLLQSQQSVAEANRVVAAVTASGASNIDAALDRWEISIAKMDSNTDFCDNFDDANDDYLANEFADKEAEQELLAELEALKLENSSNEKTE